jgi:hypothetical protein
MLLLVEPTKTGRWTWHGVLICTGFEHHASLQAELPALAPHPFLRKWLYIDTSHADFEATMEAASKRIGANDARFGILPGSPKESKLKGK